MRFTFAGTEYEARAGETLAAALVRNGVLGGFRSLYRGRPRGVYSAGEEEPNALVQIGGRPLVRATLVEVVDGLVAEPAVGKGRLSLAPDHTRCDTVHAHCDVLVVGAGRSGRAAAAAARGRVILVDSGHDRVFRASFGRLSGASRASFGRPKDEWGVTRLQRTWAVGLYDDNYAIAVGRD